MKKNLILASVLAIIFTSILIIFSPTSKKPSPSSPTPSPISTESISPSSDPTADWKTFIDNKWGYSFKYPSNWFLNNNIVSEYPWPLNGLSDPKYDFQQTYNAITTYMYPNQVWSEMTNIAFFDSLSQIHLYETGNIGKSKGKKIFTGITQDNFPYEIFEINASEKEEPYSGVEAYILNGQKLVKVTLTSYNQQSISLFNQILSTFKFIDLTDDWKTYENEKVDFTFKYPNNYSENSYDPRPNTPGSWQIQIMSPLTEDHGGPQLNSRELKIEIYIESKKVNDSLDAFFEEQAQAEDFDPQWTRSKINIAGIEAIKLNWTGMGSGISYFLINNNKRITIAKYPQNTSLDSEFNQILSTFKFTP